MARISKGGLGRRPHQRDDLGSGLALLQAPLGRGQDQRPQAQAAAGPKTLGMRLGQQGTACETLDRPRGHGHLQVCPGCPAQVSHWLLTGHGWEDSSVQMRLAGPGLPAGFPEWGRREHQGSGLRWVLGGPQPPWSPPSPHTPREGKVRMMTRVSFVCGLFFFFPQGSLTQKQYFRFLSLFCQCQVDLLCHIIYLGRNAKH